MRAWTYNRRGFPSQVLTLRHDLPQPQPSDLKPGQVLIKVSHVSLFAANSNLMAVIPHWNDKPWIPETQFSGEVVAVNHDTKPGGNANDAYVPLRTGDEVFGILLPFQSEYNGALAEYIVAPVDAVVRKPVGVSMAEASGLPGAGCHVVGLCDRAGLIEVREIPRGELMIISKIEGKRVLVTGAGTATGQTMVELVRSLVGKSGTVSATASPRSEKMVRKLGADQVIDYNSVAELHQHVTTYNSSSATRFDVIADIAGTDPLLYPKSPAYLREDGVFLFGGNVTKSHATPSSGLLGSILWLMNLVVLVLDWTLHTSRPTWLGGVPRRSFHHTKTPTQRNLRLVARLAEDGKLGSVIDRVWKMEDALNAYEYLATGKTNGKVVVNAHS